MELLEGFHAYCERNNMNCFRLHVRLSQEGVNAERWNEEFVRREIEKSGGARNIERLWVCGPPAMNETFDRLLTDPGRPN